MVEMAPNPFKKIDLASHLTIWHYTMFNLCVLYHDIMCNGGGGTQCLARSWIWNPISLYDIILYSIDIYYTLKCSAVLCCIIFCNGGRATNPFQENGFGIPSDFLIWYLHTQLTDTILYFAVLFVLNFTMVEMAPNPFQEDGSGIPSHFMILYYIQLTYTVL